MLSVTCELYMLSVVMVSVVMLSVVMLSVVMLSVGALLELPTKLGQVRATNIPTYYISSLLPAARIINLLRS
jgi:hypothetical protein